MQSEYDERSLSEPISQGDIIEKIVNNDQCKYGIIITGDCDIDKNKTNGILSYCQVIEMKDYFLNYFLKEKLRDLSKNIIDNIFQIANKAIKNKNKNHIGFDLDFFKEWILVTDFDKIQQVFNNCNAKFFDLLRIYRQFNIEEIEPCDSYIKGKLIYLCKNDYECERKKLFNDFQNKIASLPGDWFYLNGLPSKNDTGYLIYLRQIREISIDQIAINPETEKNRNFKRIGKLKSPYIYRITQMLGSVFSDIGLPKDYEDQRKFTVEYFFEYYGRIE